MDELFEAYLSAQRRRHASPLTVKAVAHALRTAQRALDREGVTAPGWSLLACEGHFDELLQAHAVSTARRHLAYLRASYRYGIRHGLCDHDPTAEVRPPRLPDLEPVTYSNDELRAIHASIRSDRDELAFHLFAFAGLRLGELAALRWNQVDHAHGQLRIVGKGGKFRLVPLHPVLHELLDERRRSARTQDDPVLATSERRPLAARTLGGSVRLLVDRTGIDVNNPCHAFRRTVATVMYEQGVRTRVIEKIMGWSPRQMYVRHYLRVADDAMRDAILTLFREDTVCERQSARAGVHADRQQKQTANWLDAETARLDALERRIDLESA